MEITSLLHGFGGRGLGPGRAGSKSPAALIHEEATEIIPTEKYEDNYPFGDSDLTDPF